MDRLKFVDDFYNLCLKYEVSHFNIKTNWSDEKYLGSIEFKDGGVIKFSTILDLITDKK